MKTTEQAKIAAQAASDKLGVDIVALDVRPLTSLADVFLFIGATSHVHVRALEDAVREAVSETGAKLIRTDGQRGHMWRVLDFGALIVHIMEQKTREFYAVERLWNAAKQVPVLANGHAPASAEPSERRMIKRRAAQRRAPVKRKKAAKRK
jgi:ribosome-associated protein